MSSHEQQPQQAPLVSKKDLCVYAGYPHDHSFVTYGEAAETAYQHALKQIGVAGKNLLWGFTSRADFDASVEKALSVTDTRNALVAMTAAVKRTGRTRTRGSRA